jgi:hypothetical protein
MGYLPNTNLAISQIKREFVVSGTPTVSAYSMNNIGNQSSPYLGKVDPYAMSSYRGKRIPPAYITYSQNDGGIWDGCRYWDVFCYMEGLSPEGSNIDPDFGYVGAYWTQNGCSGYSTNTERGCGSGTELTFGGGNGTQYAHGKFTMRLHNVMIPQNAAFCTAVHLSIWVNGSRVACVNPATNDYTDLTYDLYCTPDTSYTVEYRVNYGSC